jgi:hypothetical protein
LAERKKMAWNSLEQRNSKSRIKKEESMDKQEFVKFEILRAILAGELPDAALTNEIMNFGKYCIITEEDKADIKVLLRFLPKILRRYPEETFGDVRQEILDIIFKLKTAMGM